MIRHEGSCGERRALELVWGEAWKRGRGAHRCAARAQVEEHMVNDAHLSLRLKADDVRGPRGQLDARLHIDIISCESEAT